MRRISITCFIFLVCYQLEVLGQKLPWSGKSIYQTINIKEKYSDCAYKNTYSERERQSFYPFNIAAKVQVVSFLEGCDSEFLSFPIKNDTICYSLLKESRTLESKEIAELTDILYNINYKPTNTLKGQAGCYDPRNGIVFFDSGGMLIGYLEICFQCKGYKTSNGKIKVGEFCMDKYDILRAYFIDLGIQFGTIKLIDNDNARN